MDIDFRHIPPTIDEDEYVIVDGFLHAIWPI